MFRGSYCQTIGKGRGFGVLQQPQEEDLDIFQVLTEMYKQHKELLVWFRNPESALYQAASLKIIV